MSFSLSQQGVWDNKETDYYRVMENAQYVGFFDESGIHESARILGVGGWVASAEEWDRFIARWEAALARNGAKIFHFADFDNSRGEFSGWSIFRKQNLIKDLFRVLNQRDLFGFCACIVMPEYKATAVGSGTALEEKHSPFVICQQYCIEMISKRLNKNVFYIFDKQQEFDSPAIQNFRDTKTRFPEWSEKMSGIAFRSKIEFSPLQAADLLVYESAKSLHNWLYDSTRPIRKSMKALLKKRDRLVGGYFDRNGCEIILDWQRR
jgi:hypothetical protein